MQNVQILIKSTSCK